MKKIVVYFNIPHLTVEQYDNLLRESEPIRNSKYPGLLFHVAAPDGKGMFVCDIWESEEQFNAFGEMILPLLAKHGGTPALPTIHHIHNVIDDL